MKSETPQILWHNGKDNEQNKNAPIYSISLLESGIVSPTEFGLVLATAGNHEVNLWKLQLVQDDSSSSLVSKLDRSTPSRWVKQSLLTTLGRQTSTVNCVKFSPDGLHLATASDAGTIIVYSVPLSKRGNGNGQHYWAEVDNGDSQLMVKILGGHDGIYDLDWSADSKRFTVGTLDHVILMYASNEKNEWHCMYRNARDHSHYIQGIAMDPQGVYVASSSCDRTVRVYARKKPNKKKKNNADKLEFGKGKLVKYHSETVIEEGEEKTKRSPLFAEEAASESFFRRLSWTADGAYLVTPAALWKGKMATLLFRRHHYDVPAKVLPGHDKPSRVVVPNHVLFQLPPGVTKSNNGLAYKSVFCVLLEKSILIYDTHHSKPIAMARGLHFSGLTDAAWTPSGLGLVVSSSDGYVSFLTFTDGELGTVYEKPPVAVPTAAAVTKTTTTTPAAVVSPLVDKTPKAAAAEKKKDASSTTTEPPAIHVLQPKKKKDAIVVSSMEAAAERKNVTEPTTIHVLEPKKKKDAIVVPSKMEESSSDKKRPTAIHVLQPKKKKKRASLTTLVTTQQQ